VSLPILAMAQHFPPENKKQHRRTTAQADAPKEEGRDLFVWTISDALPIRYSEKGLLR
jgi:hypothetical protein